MTAGQARLVPIAVVGKELLERGRRPAEERVQPVRGLVVVVGVGRGDVGEIFSAPFRDAGIDEAAAVAWVAARAGRRTTVVIDSMSPAASMVPALRARGVKVNVSTAGDMSKACGLFKSDLEAGRLTQADQEAVNDARAGARMRAIGTAGGWGLDRSDPSVEIHPIVALVLARLGASMTKPTTRTKTRGRVLS